jgi:RNA polymerase sigma factor (sigma-70 family)
MAAPATRRVLRHLRATLRAPGGDLTDGELLGRFVARGDPDAFQALVRRHGPMVLGVCRRVLRHAQDAEDAFQAAFVVLARKAASVVPREAVGNWLFGVAYRTALEARTVRARRRAKERPVNEVPHPEARDEAPRRELRALLDAALERLPEKYRLPVVLCELEGRTRREVARQLGLPEGTLSSRLAAARKLLAKRLAPYAPAGACVAVTALLAEAAEARVPTPLVASTVRAAAGEVPAAVAALTQGVLKTMLLTKLKAVVGVTLLAVAVSAGAVGVSYRAAAADTPRAATVPQRDELDAMRLEIEALRKGLQATRERVRTLEAEVKTLKGASAERTCTPAPTRVDLVSKSMALTADQFKIVSENAAKDYATARFYRKLGRNGSAYYYYQLVCRRYPGTVFANNAAVECKELEKILDERESPPRVGQIVILDNEITSDTGILAAIGLYPGQVLSDSDLTAAEQRLRRRGISARVRALAPGGDSPYRDIQIQVEEKAPRPSTPAPQPPDHDPDGWRG